MKNSRFSSIFTLSSLLGLLLTLSGCATGDIERTLDEKLAKETYTDTASPIPAEAFASINSTSQLSEDERNALNSLVSRVMVELSSTRSDIAKLKKILFANLVSGEDRRDENQLIKRRIIDLDKRRLDRMFAALDEAEKLLKNNKSVKPKSLEFLLDIDRYRMQDTFQEKK